MNLPAWARTFLLFLFLFSLQIISYFPIFGADPVQFSTPATRISETQPPVHFESDSLEYQELNQVIIASGNVKVRQSSYTFHSDYATFNVPQKNLDAWGLVRFTDMQGNEIRAKFLTYSIEKGAAELQDTEGFFGPFTFAAKKVTRDDQGNFFLESARLTTCEANLKKYHLYGHRINIMPQKRLTVKHALFRVGPVPVLYLPYYYYSLGEKHLAFQFFPGQNQSEGIFVRTVWGYPPTDQTYVKAYLDYLSQRGIGTGAEFNYYFDNEMKGSVYGFRIFDNLTHQERWNARLFHWQQISNAWILQVNGNKLSDDAFPNDFFREDFNRIVRDYRSSIAFTYQKRNIFFRVLGERSELFDLTSQKFFASETLSPRIELSQFQSPLGFLKLESIFSIAFANKFAGNNSQGELLSRLYRRESDAQFTILRRFNISRMTNFIPRIRIRNLWTDRPQGNEMNRNFIQRAETETTLRQRIGHVLDIDLNYLLIQKLQDNRGDDQGRETHTLSYLSVFQPAYWFSFRYEIAHNLPRFKGEPLDFVERKNYQPMKGEISVITQNNWELFFREEYTLGESSGSMHPLSTQSEIVWGKKARGENYFSLGASYFSSQDHAFEFRQAGRIASLQKWQLEGALRTLWFYRNSNFVNIEKAEFLEKELLVKKAWRCWELSFTFRERKGVLEFLFNLELQLDRLNREKSSKPDQESEWYPWRKF